MTKIYIVRHCEAMGNIQGKFQGLTDLDITELGAKQLEALSERFKEIAIDRVYTSPLIRTKKTAMAVIGDRNIPLIPKNGLIELNGGVIENKTYVEICTEFPEFREMWANHPQDFAPENGEKMSEAYDRIWEAVLKIAKDNKGKTVVCATHGGVIRCLICRIIKNDINKLAEIPISYNTAVSLIEFDDELNCSIKFFNDHSHITEELMNNAAIVPTR